MSGWMRRRPVTAYVTLAVGLSWAVWLPLLAQTQGWIASGPWPVLHLLGSLGPAAAAIVVTAAVRGRAGLDDLGRRLVTWRGRGRAGAFALGVPPALLLLCGSIAARVGGQSPADLDWAAFGQSEEFAALPVGAFWAANLVFFGFGEEIGWRGFLQPQLERCYPLVTAANVVAIVWAAWHLPLFGITPSYRAMPAIGFVGFAASIWVASWIFAWLSRIGRGSLLIVAVFHSWFDIATTSPLGPDVLPTAMGVGVTLIGLLLLRRLLRAQGATTPPTAGSGTPDEPTSDAAGRSAV
jgi:uncharacterized protein